MSAAPRRPGHVIRGWLVGSLATCVADIGVVETRISLTDLEITLSAVASAAQNGRGALESAALTHGLHRSVVMDAVDRVEAAIGAEFFVVKIRRTGHLTAGGRQFLHAAPKVIEAWKELCASMKVTGPDE